jgi:hypothetical protein
MSCFKEFCHFLMLSICHDLNYTEQNKAHVSLDYFLSYPFYITFMKRVHARRSHLSVHYLICIFQLKNFWAHFMKFEMNVNPIEKTQSLNIQISYSQ